MSETHDKRRVWLFYHFLFNYRVPVWDRLYDRLQDRFDFRIYGMTDHGRSVGGTESRPYFHHMEVGQGLGKNGGGKATGKYAGFGYTYVGAYDLVMREKPEIVMTQPNPRNRFCRRLPAIMRQQKGVSLAWCKVGGRVIQNMGSIRTQIIKRRFTPYDAVVVYGETSKRDLLRANYPAERIHVAQNTIDTSFAYDEYESTTKHASMVLDDAGLSGKKVLLCIGKMEEQKGQMDLIKAWPLMRRLDQDLVLVFIGGGPEEEAVRAAAKEVDEHRIRFVGRVPERHDQYWTRAAAINIQPGAVGLSLNQSMALGVPTVIADEHSSDAEIVVHGETGWRFQKGDTESMVRVVDHVLHQDDERSRVTQKAREMLRTDVTVDRMVDALERCILQADELWMQRNAVRA